MAKSLRIEQSDRHNWHGRIAIRRGLSLREQPARRLVESGEPKSWHNGADRAVHVPHDCLCGRIDRAAPSMAVLSVDLCRGHSPLGIYVTYDRPTFDGPHHRANGARA